MGIDCFTCSVTDPIFTRKPGQSKGLFSFSPIGAVVLTQEFFNTQGGSVPIALLFQVRLLLQAPVCPVAWLPPSQTSTARGHNGFGGHP